MMILFYISGFITALSFAGYLRYRSLYLKLKGVEDKKDETIASLLKYKSERESKKRKAKLKTTGWHKSAEEDNPNRREWNVVFELKEVAQSAEDPNKYKFDVTAIFSEDTDDDYNFYKKWFLGNTGGGWIDTKNNKKFEWITTLTKEDIRDDKLSDLGID
jgi:hypothetical protein